MSQQISVQWPPNSRFCPGLQGALLLGAHTEDGRLNWHIRSKCRLPVPRKTRAGVSLGNGNTGRLEEGGWEASEAADRGSLPLEVQQVRQLGICRVQRPAGCSSGLCGFAQESELSHQPQVTQHTPHLA